MKNAYLDLTGLALVISIVYEKHFKIILIATIVIALIIKAVDILFSKRSYKDPDYLNKEYIQHRIKKYNSK